MRSRAVGPLLRGLLLSIALSVLAVAGSNQAKAQMGIDEWSPPTSYSLPTLIAVDPYGNLWFTEFAGNRICKVSISGQFQEFEIPTPNSQPWGIAVDAGGRVWFTESAGNKIGNLATNNVFGQDNIPTAYSQPRGIAIDGAGNLWFAESNGNKIGKMTPSGRFTEYNVPTPASQPWAVAVDGSGNVWFTERVGNKIGRLTPSSGQFSEYGIPSSGGSPGGIAIDASGNIWFAEYDSNKIGMMTFYGVFTEYNLPTPNSKPMWVAVDRYGGVWYTGSNTNVFGRIYNGNIAEYSIPTPASSPFGIVVDGSGNLWFAEQAANKIAKVTGLVPTPTPTPTFTPLPTYTPTPTFTPTATPTATPNISGLIFLPTVTPTSDAPATATPTTGPSGATVSLVSSAQSQMVSGPGPAPRDDRYFEATGYRIDNDIILDYFNKRGGVRTFGYPVSRTFVLLGFVTQFYQRTAIQIRPDGGVQTMNVLDPDIMPFTRINGSSYPPPDRSLAEIAPKPGTPGYDVRVLQFVKEHTPDWFEGLNVNFYKTFNSTVTFQDAFPDGKGNSALLPLLNLELWGVPISHPQRDPNNHNFIYQRFQRRIMHYDATTGSTQGLLLADYLKSVITGSGLPVDLESQAVGSRFYRQYNSTKPLWLDRAGELPGTDLTRAFDKQ